MKNYETEARSRWGNTDAYREYKEKTKSYIEEKWDAVNVGMMAIFAEFFACKGSGASAALPRRRLCRCWICTART